MYINASCDRFVCVNSQSKHHVSQSYLKIMKFGDGKIDKNYFICTSVYKLYCPGTTTKNTQTIPKSTDNKTRISLLSKYWGNADGCKHSTASYFQGRGLLAPLLPCSLAPLLPCSLAPLLPCK